MGIKIDSPTLPLSEVVLTDELAHRPVRPVNIVGGKLALEALASDMVEHPARVLPHLVQRAMALCGADSAGLSLFEEAERGAGVFRWHHVFGRYAPLEGATLPRDFSPCGYTLDVGTSVLMRLPERHYPYIAEIGIPNHEVLLIPLYVGTDTFYGTLWVVHHQPDRHFDAGDAQTVADLAGFAGLALRMISDAEALRSGEARQQVLAGEMAHRVRNLLAVTTALVRISAKGAASARDLEAKLLGRLGALAQAHGIAYPSLPAPDGAPRRATLDSLIATVVAPFADLGDCGEQGQARLRGPAIDLGPDALTALALIFHELVTNSVKYGALSASGILDVRWWIEGDSLLLRWEESGGPRLDGPPARAGSGTSLASRTVCGQLGGRIEHDWHPEGLRISAVLPLARLRS